MFRHMPEVRKLEVEVEGCPPHQDVESVFCIGLLYLNDTTAGRAIIEGCDLPEKFSTGDVAFLDPRQVQQVPKCARDSMRRVLVLTML